MSGLPVSGITGRPLLFVEGKGGMRMSFEIKRCDLKMVECETFTRLLRRWAVRLARLLAEARGDRHG